MKTIPHFILSHDKRIEPNSVTNIVVFDAAERAELCRLVRDAQAIADSISSGVGGFFYLKDQFVPSAFLDRMAEAFNRCDVVFLHKRVFSASEDYLVKFRATLTEPEREVAPLCVAILIAQGRLELCLPKDDRVATPATH